MFHPSQEREYIHAYLRLRKVNSIYEVIYRCCLARVNDFECEKISIVKVKSNLDSFNCQNFKPFDLNIASSHFLYCHFAKES